MLLKLQPGGRSGDVEVDAAVPVEYEEGVNGFALLW